MATCPPQLTSTSPNTTQTTHIPTYTPTANHITQSANTTAQPIIKPNWKQKQISNHLQHVHERKAIKTFLHATPHRRAHRKNKDKKHHRQAIQSHTNQKLIVNLTNIDIPQPLQSILSKGLNFVPTPPPTQIGTIIDSFKKFRRTMYIHYHFRNSTNTHKNPFPINSSWKPPLPDNSNLLKYIASIAHSIQLTFNNTQPKPPLHTNLNEEEQRFLSQHNTNQEYVIKPADKGGAIVIWASIDYEKEATSQLTDATYYEKIHIHPRTAITTQSFNITKYIRELFKYGDINYPTLQYLLPPQPPRIPIFYLLPKIHKENNPGRPIISGCDSPTDKLSSFIDHYLKPLVLELPSYIKDTNHFLQTIFTITTPLPPNTIIATIDVKSLYTNIPHSEGIKSTLDSLKSKHGHMWPLQKVIHQFLEFILKENYFTFKNQLYLQKHGTAMGTKMAPSYANIFMGSLEKSLLSSAPNHLTPLIWKRYIDDIFLIWTHGENSFLTFTDHLNSFHPTIKFECSHSTTNVNFLDTTIHITTNLTLSSSLYRKPTDRMPLLHNTSHHPQNCKKGIIYSQMLRYRRIITNNDEFIKQAQNLRVILLGRGYNDKDILPCINQASLYTQSQLLNHTTPTPNRILPFIIPYHQNLRPISSILNEHWSYIQSDNILNQIWNTSPVVAYQRHKNLKEHLVRTKFT